MTRPVWLERSRWRASALDGGLALLIAAAVIVAIHVASEPGARAPDLFAYVLGAADGAVLLGRRRWPLGTVLTTAVVLFVYYTVNYPGIEPAVPLAVALYTAASRGFLRAASGVAAFFVGADVVVHGIRHADPLLPLLTDVLREGSLVVVVLLFGEAVRSHRERVAQAQDRLAEFTAKREQEFARHVAEERLRIAREVHDIIGHSISAITVHAGLAELVFDSRPDEAKAAVSVIRTAAKTAQAELKATVGLLRADASEPWAPAPGLGDIEVLAGVARQAGLAVTVSSTGQRRATSAVLESSAYRIVQESLTNVVKHADATKVAVTLAFGPSALIIDVVDNGRGADAVPSDGFGLTGMAERAAALGGTLDAKPDDAGGFRVHLRLPMDGTV